MTSLLSRRFMWGVVLLAGCGVLPLANASDLPTVQQQGGIEYLSGGIGLEESTAIDAESRKWPLTLLFSAKRWQRSVYTADAKVSLRDGHGKLLLQMQADGPFLLLRLVPGIYVVEATLNGKVLQQRIVLKKGEPARVVFVWPEVPTDEPAQD